MSMKRYYLTAQNWSAGAQWPADPEVWGSWVSTRYPSLLSTRVLGLNSVSISTVAAADNPLMARLTGPAGVTGTYAGSLRMGVAMRRAGAGTMGPYGRIRVYLRRFMTGAEQVLVDYTTPYTLPTGYAADPPITWLSANFDPVDVTADDVLVVEVGAVKRGYNTYTYLGATVDADVADGAGTTGQAATWLDISWETPPEPEPEPEPEPVPVVHAGPRLLLGTEDEPVDLSGDAYTITVRRGGSAALPTTSLESGWVRAVVSEATVRPDTHPVARSGRPIRVMLQVDDPDDPEAGQLLPIAAGTLERAVIQYPDKGETGTRVALEAVDVLGTAGATPHEGTVHGGRFADRIAELLDGTGLPYRVSDTSPPATSAAALPSGAKSVLEQLRLIRDTMHGFVGAGRDGAVVAYADRDRPSRHDVPEFELTDDPAAVPSPTVIAYTHIDPDFDTSNVLNVLSVNRERWEGAQESTYVNRASVDEWGPSAGSVTVNDGDPGHHAARYMAERDEPRLTATRVVYNATAQPLQAYTPDLGMVCRVKRAGLLDALHEVTAIEHAITASTRRGGELRWIVTLELRPRVHSPHRWLDVPAPIRWEHVPATLTWTGAASWRP